MQVASRVLPQPQASQGALVGQARPQMATQYTPQQQAPVLEVCVPPYSYMLSRYVLIVDIHSDLLV